MEEVLFQKSFHALWQHMLKLAAEDVQKLDRKLFKDPALGGHLQKIAAKYDIDVARFEGEATAKRRVEERQGQDGWVSIAGSRPPGWMLAFRLLARPRRSVSLRRR